MPFMSVYKQGFRNEICVPFYSLLLPLKRNSRAYLNVVYPLKKLSSIFYHSLLLILFVSKILVSHSSNTVPGGVCACICTKKRRGTHGMMGSFVHVCKFHVSNYLTDCYKAWYLDCMARLCVLFISTFLIFSKLITWEFDLILLPQILVAKF
jgi:hypothetical protein